MSSSEYDNETAFTKLECKYRVKGQQLHQQLFITSEKELSERLLKGLSSDEKLIAMMICALGIVRTWANYSQVLRIYSNCCAQGLRVFRGTNSLQYPPNNKPQSQITTDINFVNIYTTLILAEALTENGAGKTVSPCPAVPVSTAGPQPGRRQSISTPKRPRANDT